MKIRLKPKNIEFDCRPGESIYEASERHEIRLPLSCRNGNCQLCKAELNFGEVETGSIKKRLSSTGAGASQAMLCKTWPLSACEFTIENVYQKGELPLNAVSCQVVSSAPIQAHVYRVVLKLPAGKLPEFYAGQYLSLDVPERSTPCFFSIASRPAQREIELHIQADPHLESALNVIRYIEQQSTVRISLPYGKACLVELPQQPLIMVAAGTGFAQMKSMLEYLFANDFRYPLVLYWGVRKADDLYLKPRVLEWQLRYPNFKFVEVIAESDDIAGVEHHQSLTNAIVADKHCLEQSLVFVSGSPKLVFSVQDVLTEQGLPEVNFFSDVLEYASRTED